MADGDSNNEYSSSFGANIRSSIKSFLAGGVGGVSAVVVGHPFDLIKVRMQAASSASNGSSGSVFGALRSTARREGIRGLYRGVSAPLVASSPVYALSFWGYDFGQTIVRKCRTATTNTTNYEYNDGASTLSIPEIMVAGGFSAIPMMVVIIPTERIKCLLQVQTSESSSSSLSSTASSIKVAATNTGNKKQPQRYSGMMDCATKIYKQGGITSLYKGTIVTVLRDVPGSIAW